MIKSCLFLTIGWIWWMLYRAPKNYGFCAPTLKKYLRLRASLKYKDFLMRLGIVDVKESKHKTIYLLQILFRTLIDP